MQTTKVIGYFNNNPWTVAIYIRPLGTSIMLAKGQYLKDASGRKINDPIFEGYAPMLLTRELGKDDLEIISYGSAAAASTVSGATGVLGTSDMSQVNSIIAASTHAGNSAIRVYTAEEAIAHGLIKKPKKTEYDVAPVAAGPGKQDPLPAAITDGLNAAAEQSQLVDVLVKNNTGVTIQDEPRLTPEQAMAAPERAVAPVVVPAVKLPTLADVRDMEQRLPAPALDEATEFVWNGTTYDSRAAIMTYLRRHTPDQVAAAAEKYPAANKKKR